MFYYTFGWTLNMGPHSCIWGDLQLSSVGIAQIIGHILSFSVKAQVHSVTQQRGQL